MSKSAMSKTVHAVDFLAEVTPTAAVPPVCVLFGDEPFLKRQVLETLRRRVLGDDDGRFGLTTFEGPKAEACDVFDELSTLPLFGDGRLIVVEQADSFVTHYRQTLEDYVARPKKSGVLVLEVSSWPSNTRLFKAVAAAGLQVECKVPPTARLLKWLTTWARQRYRAEFGPAAAEMVLEIVGPELGLVDQELAKLAGSAGPDGPITAEMVQELVGGWRAKTTWDMLDSALAGHAPEALEQLDRLLLAGENPIAVLGQISFTLRRLAAATRLIEQAESSGRRASFRQMLQAAGFRPAPFIINKAEAQLRQLGRQRGARLNRWLLEADLALKGGSSAPARARIVLEQLIARLSKVGDPRLTAGQAGG